MPFNATHILLIASWYPTKERPFLGNFVQRNAELLAEKYQVTVLNTEMSEEVEVITFKDEKVGNLRTITGFFPKGSRVKNRFRKTRAFTEGLKKVENVDLIIGHVLLPNAWMFLVAAKRKKCNLIWVEHGSYFRSTLQRKWSRYEKWMLQKTALASSEIIVVSEVLKQDLQRFVPRDKITVIGNHIDEKNFFYQKKTPREKTRFLHISTLDEVVKNPKGILDAFAQLKETNSDFELTIISDENYAKWEAYASGKQIQHQVRFIGPLDWKELPAYYHQADAFVLFSEYETFSIVLAEAIATGTPIISTDVGIAKQLTDNAIALVSPLDVADLKNKLLAFMNGELTFKPLKMVEESISFHGGTILEKWTAIIEKHAQ